MASPEVERPPPLQSPSQAPHGAYSRTQPHLSHSGDKRKALHYRYRGMKSSKQYLLGPGPNSSSSTSSTSSSSLSLSSSSTSNSGSRRSSGGNSSGAGNSNFFPMRKRSYSFSEGHCKSVTSVTPTKRWKRPGKDAKKFLLGGNIRDPLNLNSLSDEKVSKVANAVTPEYSPIPTPKHRKAEYKIEVLIPNNISDPLNLMQDDNDDDYDASFNKKKSRHRKRNHNHRKAESPKATPKKVRFSEEVKEKQPKKTVKPLQPKVVLKPDHKQPCQASRGDKKFQYGNYSRYYGYRLEGSDPRLNFFDPKWLENKDILDIGCNVGEVTMAIARDTNPKSILGIDIDPSLISKARKMVNQYASRKVPSAMATPNPEAAETSGEQRLFPQSLPILFGPLDPSLEEQQLQIQATKPQSSLFPHNIKFLCDNYVLESDDLLEFAQPEFDTILCLSTTKWIHLNFGDEGIKRAFKRMFAQLRPSGVLILEPQALASYSKKARKINQVIKDNFNQMKFMPNQFVEYLTNEVGFLGGEIIAVPEHSALGFRRPIHIFRKP